MAEESRNTELNPAPRKADTSVYLEKPYPISTPTLSVYEGRDAVEGMIYGLLGDVTLPANITPALEVKAQTLFKGDKKDLAMRHYKGLLHTPTMLYLRDVADDLANRYRNSKGYGAADAYFVREADKLHKQMEDYVKDYIEFGWGTYVINPFERNRAEIEGEFAGVVSRMLQLQKEKKKKDFTGGQPHLKYHLPESQKTSWEEEGVDLTCDENGKINRVMFNEQFSYFTFCQTMNQLAESYTQGTEITPEQVELLRREGYIDANGQLLQKDFELGQPETFVNPLQLIYLDLPEDLAEKFKDHSIYDKRPREERDFYTANNNEVPCGPFVVTSRAHDYSELQVFLQLDTKDIPNDDVYKLLGHYGDILRKYPRTRKPKRTS